MIVPLTAVFSPNKFYDVVDGVKAHSVWTFRYGTRHEKNLAVL
jgi:hypothetical protein